MTEKKEVRIAGEVRITFKVETEMTKDDIKSWKQGGKNKNQDISKKLLDELELNNKKCSLSHASSGALNKESSNCFYVDAINFSIRSIVEKRRSCPSCNYQPKDQEESYCSKCGTKLIRK